ncbi:PilZ domain-containing protein [Desulfovibrio inopinatus]|uniref:PilZ domain-containing protein n=1 Tax=Desulfovibrio inopinatus TaxID=102109 RepID=UPI0004114567|nr:PilZ domain-containing protein [Desulfovibrio inopinatus]
MDFDFKLSSHELRRGAFRTKVPGLTAKLGDYDEEFTVKDLSVSGLGIIDAASHVKEGQQTTIDLFISKRLYLKGLPCSILRVLPDGTAGIKFSELERRQEVRLDKLVLEVQKRLIELKKNAEKNENGSSNP